MKAETKQKIINEVSDFVMRTLDAQDDRLLTGTLLFNINLSQSGLGGIHATFKERLK